MSGFFEAFAKKLAEGSSDRRRVDGDRGASGVDVSGTFRVSFGRGRPVASGRRAGEAGCKCDGKRKR